jgi:arginyl-tRNA synthetase
MQITVLLKQATQKAFAGLYGYTPALTDITLNETKPEFEGDYTIVMFAFVKQLRKSPDVLANEIGEWLLANEGDTIVAFNVIKGFLNLSIANKYWLQYLFENNGPGVGIQSSNGKKAMIEYSSPNTNKPLHLGHLRNIFLGWSVAEIYKAKGYEVMKTCVVNDRGVHICKSMLAWQKFGNRSTPESTNTKGDHFVGDYYVMFERELQEQVKPLLEQYYSADFNGLNEDEKNKVEISLAKIVKLSGILTKEADQIDTGILEKLSAAVADAFRLASKGELKWNLVTKAFEDSSLNEDNNTREVNLKKIQQILKPVLFVNEKINEEQDVILDIAKNRTQTMTEVRAMLLKWEQGDKETLSLWKMMNGWVYEGFDETYSRIGADFQIKYYESDTYLLGRQLVEEGLRDGIFFRKPDGSVWIDLTGDGLDEKLVLRKDGTSVYITQDIGLARHKYEDFPMEESVYVIGDEQNYHMKVLQLICEKMNMPFAKGIHHLSYGMIDLPTGRMKSREGTVVDADDICDEMEQVAAKKTEELGKVKDFTPEELSQLYKTLGIGALKFYLLRVDPKKRMVFNPEESIDFHGFTGPFVQYTYARIQSVLRKAGLPDTSNISSYDLLSLEKALIVSLEQFAAVIEQAAIEMNPSAVALYVYNLTKTFNSFYTEHKIANAESEEKKHLRLAISQMTGYTIKQAMQLLGIDVPGRM